MDNLTHSLVGLALSRAFFKDKAPGATLVLVLAANAPDVDVLWSMGGIRYIEYHRGLTHSLLFLPVWMLLMAGLWRLWAGWRQRRKGVWDRTQGRWRPARDTPAAPNPVSWRLGLMAAFAGVGSHLLLDWTNSYGIRLLDPLSQHWFALDWMPIVDPWLWLILLAFLTLPMLLALVSREQGGPRKNYRPSALAALLAMGAWWGVRAAAHAQALRELAGQMPYAVARRQLAAYPSVMSPGQWRGIANLPDRYLMGTLGVRSAGAQTLETIYKPPATPAILAVEQSRAARIFLRFARDPWVRRRRGAHASQVVWLTDLRFGRAPHMGLRARVGRHLRLMSESFRF